MKIGVMADSHDNVPMIRRAVELFNDEQVGLVIHAGDFISPFAIKPLHDLSCRVLAVFGNTQDVQGIGELGCGDSGGLAQHLVSREVSERVF